MMFEETGEYPLLHVVVMIITCYVLSCMKWEKNKGAWKESEQSDVVETAALVKEKVAMSEFNKDKIRKLNLYFCSRYHRVGYRCDVQR